MKVKNDHRSKFSNLSNWKEEAWKKNQGFNEIRTHDLRVAGALLYQLSYEATHWERGQFIEFISPVRSEMMWSNQLYVYNWFSLIPANRVGFALMVFLVLETSALYNRQILSCFHLRFRSIMILAQSLQRFCEGLVLLDTSEVSLISPN